MQRRQSVRISLEPFVAGLGTDPVRRRELGHREQVAFVLTNKFQALLQVPGGLFDLVRIAYNDPNVAWRTSISIAT